MASLELDNSPQLHKISDEFPKRAYLPVLYTLYIALFFFEKKIKKKYVPAVNPSVTKTEL